MSNLGDINAIHILCTAETTEAADRANGTYAANIASDPRYYMWQGAQQILPLGMDGNPEGFAAGLRAALPGVNTLRLSFNAHAFDESGALHPQYERFLAAAAAQGFQLILTHTDGGQQRSGEGDGLTSDALAEVLTDEVQPRAVAAWTAMMDWLEAHPAVRAAVWGYELANEAAAYERGVILAPRGSKGSAEAAFVELYARHMAELAEIVQGRAEGRILVGGWGYSAQFDDLAEERIGTQSALDFLRSEIGADLVWAAHIYPGWHADATVTGTASYEAALSRVFGWLGSDDIMVTETSLAGHAINNVSLGQTSTLWLSRMQEWFADRGIGIGWFSGAEAGASSLVTVDGNGGLRYLHQHSLAFALNAMSLGEAPAAHAGAEVLRATTQAARLRNEVYDGGLSMDAVRKAGFAYGHGGNDLILGATAANNFLYGGTGHDRVIGAEAEDFIFGQDGFDTLEGLAGNDLLFGGRGNDLLRGGAGADTLEGGAGADRFDARSGVDMITDFSQAAGDRLYLGRGYASFEQVAARIQWAAVDGAVANDAVIRHADGSTTTVLNLRGAFSAAGLVVQGRATHVDGSADAELIGQGWEDLDGQRFSATLRRVTAGNGADTVRGASLADWIDGEAGSDLLQGYGGADTLHGAVGNDRIFGGTGHDLLMGGTGADTMRGEAENDTLSGGTGNDLLTGDLGNDVLRGDLGNDRLFGGIGHDMLHSGQGRSLLRGDAGNDQLFANIAHAGHDLGGGAGRDTFVFHSANSLGVSRSVIHDFTLGVDRLVYGSRAVSLTHLPGSMSLRETDDGTWLTFSRGNSVFLEDVFL